MKQLPIYKKEQPSDKSAVYEINRIRFNFVEEAELYQGIYALADSDSADYNETEINAISKFISYNYTHVEGLINKTELSQQNQYESLSDRKLEDALQSVQDIKNEIENLKEGIQFAIDRRKKHIAKTPTTDPVNIGYVQAFEDILYTLNHRFLKE